MSFQYYCQLLAQSLVVRKVQISSARLLLPCSLLLVLVLQVEGFPTLFFYPADNKADPVSEAEALPLRWELLLALCMKCTVWLRYVCAHVAVLDCT